MTENITKDGELIASIDSMSLKVILKNGYEMTEADSELNFTDGKWTTYNAAQAMLLREKIEEYAEKEFLAGNIDSKKRELLLALSCSYKMQMDMYLAIENEYTTEDGEPEIATGEKVIIKVEEYNKKA